MNVQKWVRSIEKAKEYLKEEPQGLPSESTSTSSSTST